MDAVSIELQAISKGKMSKMSITMQCKDDSDYFEIPSGKEVIYNYNEYIFAVSESIPPPKMIYINDEHISSNELEDIYNEYQKLFKKFDLCI